MFDPCGSYVKKLRCDMGMEFDIKQFESFKYVDDIIQSVIEQFPRKCNCCGREFHDFIDFIENTHIPEHTNEQNIQIYQYAEDTDVIAFRNCSCQSTVTVSCILDVTVKKEMIQDFMSDAQKLEIEPERVMEALRNYLLERLTASVE